MTEWDSHIPAIINELRKYRNVTDAIPAISKITKTRVTTDSLKAAFHNRNLSSPGSYTLGGRNNTDNGDVFSPPLKSTRSNESAPRKVAPAPVGPISTDTVQDPDKEIQFRELSDFLKRGPKNITDIANEFDMSPYRAKIFVEEAKSRGIRVDLAGDLVGVPPPRERSIDDASSISMPATGPWRCFAVASDIHIGSSHHLSRELNDFVDEAYAQGVRTMLHPGDLLDGVYKHSMWEQSHRGFEEQCSLAAQILPARPGLVWHFIIGNHDETFQNGSGLDVGRAIVDRFARAGRNDMVFHGERGAYVRLLSPGDHPRGCIVEMWHPKKGGAYSLSYHLQNHIRDYAVGQKPDMLFAGHTHQSVYFTSRGVHAFWSGTFQGGSSAYGKSLGGSPAMGGWIVHYRLTEHGTLRDVSPRWRAYYEREEPRLVEMGLVFIYF